MIKPRKRYLTEYRHSRQESARQGKQCEEHVRAPQKDYPDLQVGNRLHSIGGAIRLVWLQIGILLVFLLTFECLARVVMYRGSYVRDPRRSSASVPRVDADAYHGASWPRDYFHEYDSTSARWHPYVYWLSAPFVGRYINLDADGLRRTWHPAGGLARGGVRIFTFGGSTMWGEGARDDYTIPSWLQRLLGDAGYGVDVTNFGQDGYVSTQEVILLTEQLRKGNVPDLVIFYDGFNDSFSSFVNGAAGLSLDEPYREKEFNVLSGFRSQGRSILYKQALNTFLLHTALGTLAKDLAKTLSPKSYRIVKGELVRIGVTEQANKSLAPGIAEQSLGVADNSQLIDDTVTVYLANVELVRRLATSYGFRCVFYWQPALITKSARTAYEREYTKALLPDEEHFITNVYRNLAKAAARDGIHDISNVFSKTPKPYFIDAIHLSETGNLLVAQRMLPSVTEILEQMKDAPAGARGSSRHTD